MAEEKAKGKKKEKVPRQKMLEQKPEDRVKNFDEVPFGYTPELARLEAGRCLQRLPRSSRMQMSGTVM